MDWWNLDLKLNLKVLSWNVLEWKEGVTDMDLTQIPMLTASDAKIWWNGVHELSRQENRDVQQCPEVSDGWTREICWRVS